MFKSIFGRMFWTYAILLIFVISTISLSMSFFITRLMEQKQVESTFAIADSIEYWTAALQVENHDSRSERSYLHLLRSWAHMLQSDIIVTGPDGEVYNSTCDIDYVPVSALGCIETNSPDTIKTNLGGYYKKDMLIAAFPLHYNNNNIIGAILFCKSIAEIREAAVDLLLTFFMSALISLLLASIFVYIQARHITAPIRRINKASQMIAAGNFSERVDITTRDEIGQLASTFNFMASSIERADKNKNRFVSDVSHELRTPMTSISGFVEGILDGTIPDEDRNDYLKIVLDESRRLTRLVNDMLEMSKMQSDSFKLNITSFDINDLICSCIISLEHRLDDKRLDVDIDFRPETLNTLGDEDQIKRVLLNLLDNAVKFSREGSVISIKTSVSGGKAHIVIANKGDNINKDEIRHLFDRFYKTDKSRNKDRSGAGLGLSLVQNILRLHNQTITADCVPDNEGNSATISFEFTLEIK